LSYYLKGYTPEEISANLPTLNPEKIHATITYSFHNQPQIDTYLAELDDWREQHYQESHNNPSLVVQRLQAIKAAKVCLAS
jgi:trehalose utilization protein